jgi:hypothetical protein
MSSHSSSAAPFQIAQLPLAHLSGTPTLHPTADLLCVLA